MKGMQYSNQIKIKFIRYTRSQNTNRKLENKNKKNKKTPDERCNQDPKAEACTNMGQKKISLDNTVKQHNQHKNHWNEGY